SRSASSSRIARTRGRFIRKAEPAPSESNPRYEPPPSENDVAIADGADGIDRPCDRSSDRRQSVALPFVRNTRHRQGRGCPQESAPCHLGHNMVHVKTCFLAFL